MTNFNNKNIPFNKWTIFCVLSNTEFNKSNFHNVTASTFFTNEYNLKLNDDLLDKLTFNNLFHIFDIDPRYSEVTTEIITHNNQIITIIKGDLKGIINNGEIFKETIDEHIINRSVFIFHNLKWKDICKEFTSQNIIISGGSSTKRHIISPIHIRMVTILIVFIFSYKDIVTSFNVITKNKEISMPKDDLTSK